MPKIHDPRVSSGQKTILRTRRKQLSSSSSSETSTKASVQFLDDDMNFSPPPPIMPIHKSSHPQENVDNLFSCSSSLALALDTRSLAEFGDADPSVSIVKNLIFFVKILQDRGIPPCILSQTALLNTKKQEVSIESSAFSSSTRLTSVPILPSETSSESSSVFHIPKLLSTNASWKLFGDFVESVLSIKTTLHPLDISIITSDVSFLSDTRQNDHKIGLKLFWNRIRPFFKSKQLTNIHLVVLSTNSILVDDEEKEDTACRKRDLDLARCIRFLQIEIQTLEDQDLQAKGGLFPPREISTISISLSRLDNTRVGLLQLVRQWSRDSMGSQRLLLDLPETIDSSCKCSLALDAEYKSIPFRLNDTMFTKLLKQDLELLAKSSIEVVKLVPISSIDASLLYGIPIRVRPGLQCNLKSHEEMLILVQSLFHQLSLKECALLLKNPSQSTETPTKEKSKGLFHTTSQHLVLMAEELPHAIPSTGVLFRVASAEHLLSEFCHTDLHAFDNNDNPFCQHIELVFDSLMVSTEDSIVGYNPLLYTNHTLMNETAGMEEDTTGDSSYYSDIDDSIWNDDSGVGSTMEQQKIKNHEDTILNDGKGIDSIVTANSNLQTFWNDGPSSKEELISPVSNPTKPKETSNPNEVQGFTFDVEDTDDDEDDDGDTFPARKGPTSVTKTVRNSITAETKKISLLSKNPNNDEIVWTDDDDDDVGMFSCSSDEDDSDDDEDTCKRRWTKKKSEETAFDYASQE